MSKLWLIGFVALFGVAFGNVLPKQGKGQEIIGPIEDWECVANGAWPFPDDCLKYVVCWEDDVPQLGQCTDDMLFDLSYMGCNYAEYVHCGDRPRPPDVPGTLEPPVSTTTSNVSTTTTPGPSEDFDCPSDGVFPNEERCEYYWNCYAGEAQLIHCNIDYLFDLEYMGCNFPQYTCCGDRARPPGSGDEPNTCDGSTGTTTKGTTTTEPTTTTVGPTGTGETAETEPELTTAHTGPTTTSGSTTTTESGGTFVCPEPDGNFPDPEDCTAYYQCALNEPFHQYCPDGLYYNPEVGVCDFPENVDCPNDK